MDVSHIFSMVYPKRRIHLLSNFILEPDLTTSGLAAISVTQRGRRESGVACTITARPTLSLSTAIRMRESFSHGSSP